MLAEFLGNIQTNILFDVAIVIIIATLFAYIAKLLKQPLILAYVLTGVILGPFALGLIKNQAVISLLSEIGIAFLLFFVGLEISLKKLKQVTGVALVVTLIQVAVTFLGGFYLASYFGFNQLTSFYLGMVVAFSSTMIVIKLLSDKDELDTLHARIILGILLIQDIIVIMLLAVLNTFSDFSFALLPMPILKGIGLFLVAIILGKFVFPYVFKFAAKSEELLLLCGLATCFLFSLFSGLLGFSIIVGAFIAGLSLASLPYHIDIAGQVKPLKDFFALLFFVSLGMQLFFGSVSITLNVFFWFLAVVILLKPLVILIITNIFGYEKRTCFLTSMSLAQTSEFSLILVALGLSLGHISSEIFSFTVLLALVTMVFTSYLVHYDRKIYSLFSNFLIFFEKFSLRKQKLHYLGRKRKIDIVLFGCHRMGSIFLKTFEKIKKKILIVEYNPDTVQELIKKKKNCLYGDVTNTEVMKKINFENVKVVISTVKDEERSLFLIDHVKRINIKTLVIVTARLLNEAITLYTAGADYVILPHILSGEKVSELLMQILRRRKDLHKLRNKHIRHIAHIQMFGRL